MSSGGLANAASDRKARLAALKSLKRKQPDTETETELEPDSSTPAPSEPQPPSTSTSKPLPPPQSPPQEAEDAQPTPPTYLSGRNYDHQTKAPKFGFEHNPASTQSTLEKRASELAEETRLLAEKEAAQDAPLDLFKLQPKKPNWDLKRDLARKMDVLNVRTENAIARLVKERIAGQRKRAVEAGDGGGGEKNGDGENVEVGLDGAVFVEATREREREDEEDARRDRELDEDEEQGLDGS